MSDTEQNSSAPVPALTLELFEYVPESALVVVAHPDDCDFLAADVLSAWGRQGTRAGICLVTDGDAGGDDPDIPAGALSRIRLEEQRRAAAHLGVHDVRCLGHPDGMLQNTLAVRRDLVRVLREFRPELVVTMDPTSRFFGRGYINHPDHRAAADACLDAVFPSARDVRAFPELFREEGLQPHKVRFVLVGTGDRSDVAVPVAAVDVENKLAALGEHHSQFDAADMRERTWEGAREVGARAGVELAESYRLFDLAPNPSQREYGKGLAEPERRNGLPAPQLAQSQWG
ncbi:MAG TPA: PIG-L family deacetylase [Candidatus Nanopelagicaceae bacterium]|nr:PIG-L family deacetylase [Candidatus Nanopelagicaceae bacterium]